MADETKLILQLRRKRNGAIDKAIEIYTPYLSTVIYNMAGNRLSKEDTEEIISDVFIALWRNAEYIDIKKGTLRSYIAATARNCVLKRLIKQKDCVPLDETELSLKGDFSERLFSEAVWDAVMKLGEPDNEIFVRFYRYGETLKDISATTGINISTIKSKLSRGKRKLKKILNAEGSL